MDVNKLTGFAKTNFTCDKCGGKFYQEVAYSVAQNWEEFDNDNNYTYCANCVEKEGKKVEKQELIIKKLWSMLNQVRKKVEVFV